MAKIVLCSASPRRQELLRQMGLTDFDVRVPAAEETRPAGLAPRALVEHIAREKSDAAAPLCAPEEIAVTADTMVFLDGAPLGKPADEADALRMLTALQGREHLVCSGVCVRRGGDVLVGSEETAVRFRPATHAELLGYIRTGEPMDKAGAYGIQGLGALLVEGIRGDYTNVVGLPVGLLARLLEPFGVSFFDGGSRA